MKTLLKFAVCLGAVMFTLASHAATGGGLGGGGGGGGSTNLTWLQASNASYAIANAGIIRSNLVSWLQASNAAYAIANAGIIRSNLATQAFTTAGLATKADTNGPTLFGAFLSGNATVRGSLSVTGATPTIFIQATNATANHQRWKWIVDTAGTMKLNSYNDAESAAYSVLSMTHDSAAGGLLSIGSGLELLGSFYIPTGAQNGYVWTSDGSGLGSWQAASGGSSFNTNGGSVFGISLWGTSALYQFITSANAVSGNRSVITNRVETLGTGNVINGTNQWWDAVNSSATFNGAVSNANEGTVYVASLSNTVASVIGTLTNVTSYKGWRGMDANSVVRIQVVKRGGVTTAYSDSSPGVFPVTYTGTNVVIDGSLAPFQRVILTNAANAVVNVLVTNAVTDATTVLFHQGNVGNVQLSFVNNALTTRTNSSGLNLTTNAAALDTLTFIPLTNGVVGVNRIAGFQ